MSRTITVSVDNSGEYSTLQAAIGASSVGDTILLGPGRYTDSFEWAYNGGAWTNTVFAAVNVDSLVIRGSSRDQVIIGPETPGFTDFGPKGIVVESSVSALWVEGLTLENVYAGVYTPASGEVSGCLFRSCEFGISIFSEMGLQIRDCEFLSGATGVAALSGARDVLIEDCLFRSEETGLRFASALDCVVQSCRIEGGLVGTIPEGGSTVQFVGCTFDSITTTNIYLPSSHVVLTDNYLGSSGIPIWLSGVSSLQGSGNVVEAGEVATMRIKSSAGIDFQGNDIFTRPGGRCILAVIPSIPGTYTFHMENNYWGTTDTDSISTWIWDGSDDPGLSGYVDFLPIANESVPTEKISLGSVKSMFR